MSKKARLYQVRKRPHQLTRPPHYKMWVFECPCEPHEYPYWHWAAAYGTMLWHMHLYHQPPPRSENNEQRT